MSEFKFVLLPQDSVTENEVNIWLDKARLKTYYFPGTDSSPLQTWNLAVMVEAGSRVMRTYYSYSNYLGAAFGTSPESRREYVGTLQTFLIKDRYCI